MTHKTASAAWRSWNAASDERMNHPPGEEGLMLSLNEVVRMAREGRLHPRVRAWVTHRLRDAGDPKGIVPRADALLGAIRAQAIWVPDPDHTEQMLGAHLILDDIFAGGDCFPENTQVVLLDGERPRLANLQDLKVGDAIWGLDRWSTVQAKADKGLLVVDEIWLNNGTKMRLTSDHHVYVRVEGGEKRVRVSELAAGDVLSKPLGPVSGVPHVVSVEGEIRFVNQIWRNVERVHCWDIQTDDHRVYLPEYDVTSSQCDDLTIAYVAALGAALENINGRVAIVGHAYDGGPYGHVLCALHDGEKWLFADPSTKKPIGTAVGNVTDEIMLDVMTGEVICQGICMVNGSNRAPAPKDPEGSGTFQRINGVPGYEIMEMAMLGRFEPGDTEEVEDDGDLAGHAALSDDMDREGVTAVPMGDLPQKSADLPTKPDCGCSGEHPWQDAWGEHIDLTRAYILTRAKLGQDAAVSGVLPRLMDNQDWLGRLFESVSKGSGPAVTTLLKEHIAKAGDVVEKLVAKEDAKAELTSWYVNAEDIAKALSKLGMGPLPDLREMMWNHLDATAQEAKAIVAGDEAKSMKWYEDAKAQALEMANEFAKLDPIK